MTDHAFMKKVHTIFQQDPSMYVKLMNNPFDETEYRQIVNSLFQQERSLYVQFIRFYDMNDQKAMHNIRCQLKMKDIEIAILGMRNMVKRLNHEIALDCNPLNLGQTDFDEFENRINRWKAEMKTHEQMMLK
jgi:hypothetical protein